MIKFSERLKCFRTERGFSQKQLADKAGVSKQNISDWENDKSETSFDVLIKLAEVLQVTVGQLVGSEDL